MKKLIALVLALALVATLGLVSFTSAEGEGHTITLNSTDTHTYRVYQVLTGTLSAEGSRQLGNPTWGADVISNPGTVADFIASITASGLTQAQIGNLVYAKIDTTSTGRGTVDKDHPLTGLATGYYLLEDITAVGSEGFEYDTKALYVVDVLNDIASLTIKHDTTSDDKEITTDTLGTGDANTVNGDYDNVSVGDTVNYKITAKVPAKATDYNYFYFVINDKLDAGLTFTTNSIHVYHGSVADANKLDEGELTEGATQNTVTGDYVVKYNVNNHTFEIALNDAKTYAGQNIIVTYSAVVNENAVIGETPNKNTSTVTFSNNPNHDYDGEKYPGFPDEKESSVLDETPVTQTFTFTTAIQLKKVDENGNVLLGAAFTITGNSAEIVLVSSETFTKVNDGEGEYYKLTGDRYTKDAPVNEHMEEAAAGATAGWVEDVEGEKVVGGKHYREYVPATDGDAKVYIYVKGNADQYVTGTKDYTKEITYTQKNTKTSGVTATAAVGADGVVIFRGLGEGTYTITESTTPAGYNTLSPLTLTITFAAEPDTNSGEFHWETTSNGWRYNSTTGMFETTVVNNKGTQLPSTGGIGTTIFYILGGLLVVGAAVVLVARRKAGQN